MTTVYTYILFRISARYYLKTELKELINLNINSFNDIIIATYIVIFTFFAIFFLRIFIINFFIFYIERLKVLNRTKNILRIDLNKARKTQKTLNNSKPFTKTYNSDVSAFNRLGYKYTDIKKSNYPEEYSMDIQSRKAQFIIDKISNKLTKVEYEIAKIRNLPHLKFYGKLNNLIKILSQKIKR